MPVEPVTAPAPIDRMAGVLLVLVTVLVIVGDWGGPGWTGDAAAAASAAVVALLSVQVRPSRRVFVLVGLGLLAVAAATRADWLGIVDRAGQSAAFIAAFFVALTTLRHAAGTSPAIRASGRFLAAQPPGRRYLALTMGGQLFALLLNYGAISLLGSLAAASAAEESNEEVRTIRIRRMLLAIQRGFVSMLPWSPLAFATAISTSLIPGASWAAAALPCLVSGAILAGTGWALDTAVKPRLKGPRPPPAVPEGGWASLLPLFVLLAILGVSVAILHAVTGIPAVGIVIVVVPVMAMVWVWMQGGVRHLWRRAAGYVTTDLSLYRGEIVLLMMAGFIGAVGSALLAPVVARAGIDLSGVPAPLLLVALVWIIPITGQLGMNPILSVSIIAPVLPEASTIGVAPADIIAAITAGWALSGASSPYTATTLLVGSFGGVSAERVGLVWNGVYTVVCAVLLSGWVALLAIL